MSEYIPILIIDEDDGNFTLDEFLSVIQQHTEHHKDKDIRVRITTETFEDDYHGDIEMGTLEFLVKK